MSVDTGQTRVEAAADSVPERIELKDQGRQLWLRWPGMPERALGAATLRNACRCAGCTHARRNGAGVQIDTNIALRQVAAFGVAGLQLVFSDGHGRGIFPWAYLRQLASAAG